MNAPGGSAEEARRLIHDLELHQQELQLQNEELRQAQAERDAAGAIYFDFYDLAPVGYCSVSEHGLILAANLTTAALLGVTRGDLVGLPMTHFIFPPDQDSYYLYTKQLLQGGGSQSLELRMVKSDGTPIWVGLESLAARDAGGALIVRLVLIDIGRRKQAEAALVGREEYLLTILRTTADGFWVLDAEGKLRECNDTLCRMLGYTREELLTLGIPDINAAEGPSEIAARMKRISQKGSKIFQTRHRRKDGSVYDVEISVTYLAEDGGRFICFGRDISARKGAEAVTAARLRLLLLAQDHSLAELLQATLDETEALTNSQVGFYHFMEADQVTLSLQSWSTNTTRHMCKAQGSGLHYPVEQAGVWVDCVQQRKAVIHNDYASLPHRKGLPEGHAAVTRELVVPVMRGDSIVALLGVGNKPQDYDERDIAVVESLADLAWDITARKRVEEALEESERQLRLITDNIPALLAYVNAGDLRYRFVNKVFADVFGGSPETYQGRQSSQVLGAETYAQALPFINRARAGERVEFDVSLSQRGETRWFHVAYIPTVGPQGEVESIIALSIDISERKRVEEALEESERQLRLITDNIPAVVSYVNASDLRYRFVNKVFGEVFGGSPETFQGKHVCQVLAAEAYARALPFINRALQGERVEYEAHVPVRGESRWFNVAYIPRVGPQGTVENIIVLAIDINDRKQAEAEKLKLEAQNRQLVKAESLGRMAGAVAHHFNNQLQAVMGFVELALMTLPQPCPGPAEYLSEALQSAHKAAEVSGLMLTYLGQTSGRREALDLSEACGRYLPLLQAEMPGQVTLESDWPSPGPRISANPSQLHKIVTNLLRNAWEAVEQNPGVVHVSISTALASDISESHRFPIDSPLEHSAYACLKVSDSGCGIAEQDIEKLFDPFFSTKFTGRGLGLPVVLGIVRAHEGVITVASEPGRGSIFCVYLPLTRDEICRPPTPASRPQTVKESGTVLVVDDEQAIRKLAVRMLTQLGFSALAAQDGLEAVEVFRQHPGEIRCVVCDLTMPRMDGWATIAALRGIRPGIPVVLASGYTEEQVMNGDHPERPNGFLHKPYRQEQLYQAIRQALSQEPGDLEMGAV